LGVRSLDVWTGKEGITEIMAKRGSRGAGGFLLGFSQVPAGRGKVAIGTWPDWAKRQKQCRTNRRLVFHGLRDAAGVEKNSHPEGNGEAVEEVMASERKKKKRFSRQDQKKEVLG